ncbi:MAG TPA: histidine phosphatase family protein [Methanocorpusculum sp.]|nr:histidine phosphatase family protein [Methanocorpusculum sp.]
MEFPKVSADGTHHIFEGSPVYAKRFTKVRDFFLPGAAAVCDDSGWYHINFFGDPLYDERYTYAGDFCEDLAVVRDAEGLYYHIDAEGNKIEADGFLWAGGFFEGAAVVYDKKRGATHITTMDEPLYNIWFYDARAFQNGRALVRDAKGWLYIDRAGNFISRAAEPADSYPRGSVCAAPFVSPVPAALAKAAPYDAAVLFIRHAEREPFQRGEFGSLKILTRRGEEAARAFGEALPGARRGFSSPVPRCVRTAELIAGKNETSTVLGYPSVYVISDDIVNGVYTNTPVMTVVREYIARGVLPGHVPIGEATEKMLAFLKSVAVPGEITVCVSHDVFVAAFCAYLTKRDFSDDRIDFLDGCILLRRGGKWTLWWRENEYQIE